MKLTTFTALCVMGTTAAAHYKQLTNTTGLTLRDNILLPRCSGSCDECFGAGNVPCVGLTCYNPGAGEGQSLQDCAASLGVPVPTSSAAASPTATATGGSSDDGSDTGTSENVGQWVSNHKGIIAGAAAGLVVLILLLACLGIYRRRRIRTRYLSASNAPPVVYQTEDIGSGQYVYSFAPHQNIPVTQARYMPK
ncbi:hypothetical protein LTR47_007970 [Exophiala xenobiotica]|nr:hypothetical protein LTR41_002765 [Exophiala xenobiotica]KAK5218687.1 hypothetical protein LTR72_008626 [Exophiala xenobiotica]KAK5229079.1 hypothetical protein LTR47_007970 [Exophiala xenobiotica]KAK5252999.1 hypothetical protein LTS06_002457 [Exophiala xenobiotica]KAK5283589.1 hypothetical protein LTR40_001494 [Exophiala xenobiotica]